MCDRPRVYRVRVRVHVCVLVRVRAAAAAGRPGDGVRVGRGGGGAVDAAPPRTRRRVTCATRFAAAAAGCAVRRTCETETGRRSEDVHGVAAPIHVATLRRSTLHE